MKTSVVLCCVHKQKVEPVQTRAKYEGSMRELCWWLKTMVKAHCGP